MNPAPEHVAAPVPPAPTPPHAFPVLATMAPVVVSLALWAVTGSVFALVFAALGPAVALASLADARLQSRRRSSREEARFTTHLAAARSEISRAHERETAEIAAGSPTARRLVAEQWPESEQWLRAPGDEIPVCVGWGERTSSLVLDGATVGDRGRGPAHESLRSLAREAARLRDAPVVVDARLGIGVFGRTPLATAVARGILVQVLASVSPASCDVVVETADDAEWQWLWEAPHVVRPAPGGDAGSGRGAVVTVGIRTAGVGASGATTRHCFVIAVAEHRGELPRSARVVVDAGATGARVSQHPDRSLLADLRLEPVSRQQAVTVVRGMPRHAGPAGGSAAPPGGVTFSDCTGRGRGEREVLGGGDGLGCIPAMTGRGPLRLDLVTQGPHAIVGGTTGSGKSELLTGWVLAMAHERSPREVNVLLVDFKGGSAFAPLVELPHCVGMITDLDEAGAARALASLSAELRRRERHLASAGAKSIAALRPDASMPRLVIMVDEFAAMVGGFPDLHAVFADIAARGRSLGVHLVLCTQRPAGVIRDAVLANSGLRVSLRVNNSADSMAVIGTDDASALPLEPRGRAWVAADGVEPVLAQFPLVTPADVDAVRARWAQHPFRPHRPWLDPLPAVVPLDDLPPRAPVGRSAAGAGGVAFGLLDDPGEQAQPAAVYRPGEHGNLLAVGGAGTGKSTLLSTLEVSARSPVGGTPAVAALRLPADIEAAWDMLRATLEEIRGPGEAAGRHRLLLVDDLDALLPRFPDEYGPEVIDLLGAILREGPARGIHSVVTAQRLTAGLHPVAALCGSRIHLRLPSRQEHVLAGGDGAHFTERLPPGGGHWLGLRLQVAVAPDGPRPAHARPAAQPVGSTTAELDLARPLAVVSRHPSRFGERLRRALPRLAADRAILEIGAAAASGVTVGSGQTGLAIVGDTDSWQAQWGVLGQLRGTRTIVVEGYGAAEFRTLTRERELPPPLAPGGHSFWILEPGERPRRGVLPRHPDQ
jgi:S-DNA-T family DNA segregation ATPase FtsK/SpoIIIE